MGFVSVLKKENEKGITLEVHKNAHSLLLIPLMHLAFLVKFLHVTDTANGTPTAPETKSDI